ncbi:MAG: rhamnogalacturonan acetylesterase [Bryobacteraceae bacterium]
MILLMRALLPFFALALAAAAQDRLPTLYVIGDSTANNVDHRGWADPFAAYFDSSRIHVVNRARAGRSSRTFVTEGLWEQVRDVLQPGDYVLIQFGHNDGGPPDQDRARGSLPGLGDAAKDFTLPNGSKETVYTFGHYMRQFIAETKAKGATPVMLSLTVRNIWKDGAIERGPANYSQWSADIAKPAGVQFLDVTNAIADRYEKLGPEKVAGLFPEDHTHTSPAGAELVSSLVVSTIKGAKGFALSAYLSDRARSVEPYPAPLTTAKIPLPSPANPGLPTLFLIGDSTVRNGRGDGANGQWGWGEPLVDLFDTSRINVVNRAVGGLSSRTYYTGYWQDTLAMLKPGDFVMMQFGHNDGGPLDDAARARGTLPGAGVETREIDNPISKQHETVHTYGWYLKQFIEDARAKGATPIMCTLIPRKTWNDGRIVRNADTYAGWARQVAASKHTPLIDLNELIAQRYDALGPEEVEPLFGDPHTHTSRAGAELNAQVVVDGLKILSLDPLAAYLK